MNRDLPGAHARPSLCILGMGRPDFSRANPRTFEGLARLKSGLPGAWVASRSQVANLRARRRPAVALLLGLLVSAASAEDAGTIAGSVAAPGGATAVRAIRRDDGKTYPGTVDAAGVRFQIDGLPPGKYDCLIDFGAASLEGVNLAVPTLDEDGEPAGSLSDEDKQSIRESARSLNKFEDVVEVLGVLGNARHAAVLINKVRTSPFVNSRPGEAIWRAELWHFERPDETWVKVQDELFVVLHRERIMKADYDRKSVTFDPALGGVAVAAGGKSEVGRVAPPDPAPGVRLRGGGSR